MQKNRKCRLCCDKNKTLNHGINGCNKRTQKEYKTWHDWVGKVIHLELYKKLKSDHKTESAQSAGALEYTDYISAKG